MQILISICLFLTAVIHLLPLMGILGQAHLQRLYGLALDDVNMVILLQHRAVLFGLLGCFLMLSVWVKSWQLPALIAAFISVVSFLLITELTGGYNQAIKQVVVADWAALVLLIVATYCYWRVSRS